MATPFGPIIINSEFTKNVFDFEKISPQILWLIKQHLNTQNVNFSWKDEQEHVANGSMGAASLSKTLRLPRNTKALKLSPNLESAIPWTGAHPITLRRYLEACNSLFVTVGGKIQNWWWTCTQNIVTICLIIYASTKQNSSRFAKVDGGYRREGPSTKSLHFPVRTYIEKATGAVFRSCPKSIAIREEGDRVDVPFMTKVRLCALPCSCIPNFHSTVNGPVTKMLGSDGCNDMDITSPVWS